MKKYIFPLIIGMFLLSMQTASAATLTLTNVLDGVVNTASGLLVNGTASGTADGPTSHHSYSEWTLNLDADADVSIWLDNTANPPPAFLTTFATDSTFANLILDFNGLGPVSQFLLAGQYTIGIIAVGGEGIPYDLNVSTAVPVPAAIWLFGSSLMGLIGFARRKSS